VDKESKPNIRFEGFEGLRFFFVGNCKTQRSKTQESKI